MKQEQRQERQQERREYIGKECVRFVRYGAAYGIVPYSYTKRRTMYYVVRYMASGAYVLRSSIMTRKRATTELYRIAQEDFANGAMYGLQKVVVRIANNGGVYSVTWHR